MLKIISMIMVVILHINLFGGLNKSARLSDDLWFKFVVNFYEELCIIAVNVFVIISAWFLSASKKNSLNSKRILRLVISMFFWYIITTVFAFILGVNPDARRLLVGIPLLGSSYDFIAGYLVMYFCSPFLNRLTNQSSTKSNKLLAIVTFVLFCLLAPFVRNGYLLVNGGYSFAWFICIYIMVSNIRKIELSKRSSFLYYLGFFLILTMLGTICRCMFPKLYCSQGFYNDPIIFFSALSIFFLFNSFTIVGLKTVKVIQFFVPLSVAVFFIHANPFIEEWFRTLRFSNFINERLHYYMLVVPALAVVIFFVCTMLEYIREAIFEKIGINKFEDKLSMTIDKHLII